MTFVTVARRVLGPRRPRAAHPDSGHTVTPSRSILVAALVALPLAAHAAPVLVNTLTVSGNAVDATACPVGGCTANQNRLSLGSDLYYDTFRGTFFGLPDRGPGGGVVPYETRIQQFTLGVNSTTGAISGFSVSATTPLLRSGVPFNGLNPLLLSGSSANLGLSLDPEGLVVRSNGNFLISDEYGPSVYEFAPDGTFIRAFTTPANLTPQAGSTPNFVDGRPTITSGRQDNRGFEGLSITPDGSTLFAVLQDPLVNEGSSNDGRRSQNVRIVAFDVATGQPKGQYVYRLESIADINARIPGTTNDFSATQQGRSIGLSAIVALNDHEFLVLERDNRGFGADPSTLLPVGSKRVYRVDVTGATDVSGISLANSNTLPSGVAPVARSLYLDIQAALEAQGVVVPEKIEGLTIGPRLDDGRYLMLVATDNDFSVTQTGSGQQFDVCTNGTVFTTENALGGGCPAGQALVPSYLYAFAADFQADGIRYVAPVSLPGTAMLLGIGLAAAGWRGRLRKGG